MQRPNNLEFAIFNIFTTAYKKIKIIPLVNFYINKNIFKLFVNIIYKQFC